MTNQEIIEMAGQIVSEAPFSTEGKLEDVRKLLYLLILTSVNTCEKLDSIKTTTVWGPKI